MGRQFGGAPGLAVLVTVAPSATKHSILRPATAVTRGYQVALLIVAALAVARRRRRGRIKQAHATN